MGFLVTWQELWMLMGSGFGMVSFGLGRGQGVHISSNFGVYRHLSTSRSTSLAGTPMSLLVGRVEPEHGPNCSDDRSTYKFSLL